LDPGGGQLNLSPALGAQEAALETVLKCPSRDKFQVAVKGWFLYSLLGGWMDGKFATITKNFTSTKPF